MALMMSTVASEASAQQPEPDNSIVYPELCPAAYKHPGIDLLILMDTSGSMSKSDKGGRNRRDALRGLRSRLATLARALHQPDQTAFNVQIALWTFNDSAKEIVGFARASEDHPSDEHIDKSVQSPPKNTDYLEAFEHAIEAFPQTVPPSQDVPCRVLIFFTDGIHDPSDRARNPLPEEQQDPGDEALDLLGDACKALTNQLAVDQMFTYAVVLGDEFRDDKNAADLRVASKYFMRAVTGDTEGNLAQPSENEAKTWRALGTQPCASEPQRDQRGKILEIDNVGELAATLSEAAEGVSLTARGFRGPKLCESGGASPKLPDGTYIQEIAAFATGATKYRYSLSPYGADAEPGKPKDVSASVLRLSVDDYGDMEFPWVLNVDAPEQPEDEVRCYFKAIEEPPKTATISGALKVGGSLAPADDQWTWYSAKKGSRPVDIQVVAERADLNCNEWKTYNPLSDDGRGSQAADGNSDRAWYRSVRTLGAYAAGSFGEVSTEAPCPDEGSDSSSSAGPLMLKLTLEPLSCNGNYDFSQSYRFSYVPEGLEALFGAEHGIKQTVQVKVEDSNSLYHKCGAPRLVNVNGGGECDGGTAIVEGSGSELSEGPVRLEIPCSFLPSKFGTSELGLLPADNGGTVPDGGSPTWQFDKDYYGEHHRNVSVTTDSVNEGGPTLLVGGNKQPDGELDAEIIPIRLVTARPLDGEHRQGQINIKLKPQWQPPADGDGAAASDQGPDATGADAETDLPVDQQQQRRINTDMADYGREFKVEWNFKLPPGISLALVIFGLGTLLSLAACYWWACRTARLKHTLPNPYQGAGGILRWRHTSVSVVRDGRGGMVLGASAEAALNDAGAGLQAPAESDGPSQLPMYTAMPVPAGLSPKRGIGDIVLQQRGRLNLASLLCEPRCTFRPADGYTVCFAGTCDGDYVPSSFPPGLSDGQLLSARFDRVCVVAQLAADDQPSHQVTCSLLLLQRSIVPRVPGSGADAVLRLPADRLNPVFEALLQQDSSSIDAT
ncbi:vWA domain-containing protein [Candidatus Poriferisodalis sp.]|uniref:vWA domain-containing protein n=1 Tax=Candidatus Poriferisodalis sp. TaxID=3101277 RepID=UPI003B01251F